MEKKRKKSARDLGVKAFVGADGLAEDGPLAAWQWWISDCPHVLRMAAEVWILGERTR
jgi:hypothetical protein